MGKLFDSFMRYFASTTAQQRKADWEELKAYNEYGPIVLSSDDIKYDFLLNLPQELERVTAEDEMIACSEDCSLAA